MQQNVVLITIASLVVFYLSGNWMFGEVRFVLNMSEFDQDISWLVQVPLMLFILILILGSFLLFIGTIIEFNFKEFVAEVPWKKLLGSILIFDAIIIGFMWIHVYFDIQKSFIGQFLVVILLVTVYIYGAIKHSINPIFFLVSLVATSVLLPYIFFEVIS
jgi:hypothetical protein